jgi:hypothetical protein
MKCVESRLFGSMKKYLLGAAGVIALALVVVLFVLPGKKTRPDAVTPDGTAVQFQMLRVANVCNRFIESHRRLPASFEELAQFSRGIQDEINEKELILPRDKQPMVIRYGLKLPPPRALRETDTDGPILAHEQTGVNGRRFVVFAGSNRVVEIDDGVFQQSVQP